MKKPLLEIYLTTLIVVNRASVHARSRDGDRINKGSSFGQAPVRTDGCPWEKDRVICGDNIVYSNLCFASKAGYKYQDCRSYDSSSDSSSPSNNSKRLKCQDVSGVVCGASQESFVNLCLAQMNGYRTRDCYKLDDASSLQRRTLQQETIFCAQVWVPVYCTLEGIVFSSRCHAKVDGYSPADCTIPVDINGYDSDCPDEHQNEALSSKPVICNGETFDNICWASQAGYIPKDDCGEAVFPDGWEPDTKDGTSKNKTACSERPVRPVTCVGTKNETVVFDNRCFARWAGYKGKDCPFVAERQRRQRLRS